MDRPRTRARHQQIGLVLGLIAFAGALLVPTPDGMTVEGQRMIAVTLLMSCWWVTEAIDLALTSLLPLALLPLLGIMPSAQVAPYYADHTIYLFFGGFIIALAIQKWNLHRRIALHTMRLLGVEPARLLLGLMTATAFLSMWMSNTACTLMILPIAIAVVLQLAGESSGGAARTGSEAVIEHFGSVVMLGVAYAASIGGLGTLIGTPPNLVLAGAVTTLLPDKPVIGFLQWMGIGVPVTLVLLPATWWYLCRFGARVPLRKLRFSGTTTVVDDELAKLGLMSHAEKLVLGVWLTAAFLWMTRAPIALGAVTMPGWSQLFERPGFISDTTVAIVMGLVLCLLPIRQPDPASPEDAGWTFLMDWQTLQTGIPWGILLLFGGGFALAAGFEASKLSAWIGSLMSGARGLDPVAMVVLSVTVLMVLTALTSNTAVAILAMPILASAAMQMAVHPYLLMVPGALAASCAFVLPVSTPPNAIVFGSGWIGIPQMARVGAAINVIALVVVTAAVVLLGELVFGVRLF
jgi:sodium-dependent dicarboxylate transporter 2/3/5